MRPLNSEAPKKKKKKKKGKEATTSAGVAVATMSFGVYFHQLKSYVERTRANASINKAGTKVSTLKWIDGLSFEAPLIASVLYLSMVFVGPKIMRKRDEPFNQKAL